jgi:hypothetical protein
MGVWAPGSRPLDVDPFATAQAMRPVVEAWFDCHIQIIDPASMTSTEYDAFEDTGGSAEGAVLWDSGADGALISPIRTPRTGDLGEQSVAVAGIRIQCFVPPTVELRNGLVVKVIDGGTDAQLKRYRYVLAGGISSSIGFVHVLHASVAQS